MQVNFNNLRKQSIFAYEDLVKKLNASIIKNEDQYAVPNEVRHGQQINLKGHVLIDAESIQKDIDTLRTLIGAIAMCCDPEDPDIDNVYEKVYPEEKGKSMPCFNEQE